LNRRGRGGGGRGRRQDSKDEDEDWNDETSPEIRVMKARQSGQYSIPSWAKTLEIKGHGRMIGEKSKKLEDSPYVVLREFRGGQLPEDVSAARKPLHALPNSKRNACDGPGHCVPLCVF
jgi:hypothetical protein